MILHGPLHPFQVAVFAVDECLRDSISVGAAVTMAVQRGGARCATHTHWDLPLLRWLSSQNTPGREVTVELERSERSEGVGPKVY